MFLDQLLILLHCLETLLFQSSHCGRRINLDYLSSVETVTYYLDGSLLNRAEANNLRSNCAAAAQLPVVGRATGRRCPSGSVIYRERNASRTRCFIMQD